MRAVILSLMTLGGASAWGMARNILSCQSYFMAPRPLKLATVSLLSSKTRSDDRLLRRKELVDYVNRAAPGSELLAEYLKSLAEDSLPSPRASVKAFSERLLMAYLIQAGNEKLALKYLPDLLNVFWNDLIYGYVDELEANDKPDRLREGFAWTETLLSTLIFVAPLDPDAVSAAWSKSYDEFLPRLLDHVAVGQLLHKTQTRLQQRQPKTAKEPFAEVERLKYLLPLADELNYPTPSPGADSLMKFYVFDDAMYAKNEIFNRDMRAIAGSDLTISPARALIFLLRLQRRLGPAFPMPDMYNARTMLEKFKKLRPSI